jgi:HEAT repeat protein
MFHPPHANLTDLLTELERGGPRQRRRAAVGLSMRPEPAVEDALLNAVADEDTRLRWTAIFGLIERNPPHAAELILERLAAGGQSQTTIACDLVTLALPVDVLRRLMSEELITAGMQHAEPNCRRQLTALLPRLLPPQQALRHLARAPSDASTEVRVLAAQALIDAPGAKGHLESLARND